MERIFPAPSSLRSARLPPESKRISRPVVFALQEVRGAAVVEAEDFIRKVQALRDYRKTLLDPIADLRVDLSMRKEVDVARRALGTQGTGVFTITSCSDGSRALLPLVLEDAGAVVGHADAGRETAFIVGRTEIERHGSLALQSGMVRADGKSTGVGVCPAVVGRNTKSIQHAGKESKVLDVSRLEAIKLRVDSVDDVVQVVPGVGAVVGISWAECRVVNIIDGRAQLLVEKPPWISP